jgi:predicted phage terminase large subunit-like protein
MINNIIPPSLAEQMFKDRNIRIAITRKSHLFFFNFYFADYVKYETAPFQHELFYLTECNDITNLFVVAFRGSGKSTILTLSYPLWALLGEQQKKFALILCQTRSQAKQHMMNLKRELESNQLLKNDLGPFQEENDEWGSSSLVFSRINARITAASSEQSIRGIRHHQYRPDLIICDDVEDTFSVKTREGRDKTHNWLRGEVIPAGDRNTKLVVVGNLLHEDGLMMRLKQDLEEKRLDGTFKSYPLIDKDGKIAWPGKYQKQEDIETEQRKVGNDIAWQREYLLRIVSDAGQVVHSEWIQRYDEIPFGNNQFVGYYIGVDLAISQKETADYTAMVVLKVYCVNDQYRAYVLPFPINKRLTFPEQVNQIKSFVHSLKSDRTPDIYIESTGYQESLIQDLNNDGLWVVGIPVRGDKRERLTMTTAAIQNGLILFPRKGAEELIMQLTGFGIEKHDDMADAFSLVANQFIVLANRPTPKLYYLF